jgi:hypothetical protein
MTSQEEETQHGRAPDSRSGANLSGSVSRDDNPRQVIRYGAARICMPLPRRLPRRCTRGPCTRATAPARRCSCRLRLRLASSVLPGRSGTDITYILERALLLHLAAILTCVPAAWAPEQQLHLVLAAVDEDEEVPAEQS